MDPLLAVRNLKHMLKNKDSKFIELPSPGRKQTETRKALCKKLRREQELQKWKEQMWRR